MHKLLYVIVFLIISSTARAQVYQEYAWEESPAFQPPIEQYASGNIVGLKQISIVEFLEQGNELKLFTTSHKVIHVQDEAAIQDVNRVYIPMYNAKQLVDIKARTITQDGSVRLMDKSNIKELKNVEEYGDFKIFALEGVEPNSNVEIMYTIEKKLLAFWVGDPARGLPYRNCQVHFHLWEQPGASKGLPNGQQICGYER